MGTMNRRLTSLETIWPQPKPTPDADWSRLTEAEQAEYVGICQRAGELGGLDRLTDDDVDRGAELADKLIGDKPPAPRPWPMSQETAQ